MSQLMEKISTMWTILQVSEEEQEQFKQEYQRDLSSDTIVIVLLGIVCDMQNQQYLQQLEYDVQAKLEVLIPSIRNEIEGIRSDLSLLLSAEILY